MTKDDSKVLYGLAVLLMIWHHLFKTPGSLECDVITIGSILSLKVNYTMYIAWFGKICVAIYAFISGYAMSIITRNKKNKVSASIKQVKKLYFKYWIVFLGIIVLFSIFGYKKITFDKTFLLNLVAVKFDYNGAWWYVRNYVLMILLFPLLEKFIMLLKNKKLTLAISSVIALIWIGGGYCVHNGVIAKSLTSVTLIYLGIFIEGIIAAQFDLIKSLCKKLDDRRILLFVFILIISVRMAVVRTAGDCSVDLLLVLPFVCCVKVFFNKGSKTAKKAIQFIGENSTYMWLVHGFFFEIPFLRYCITRCRMAVFIYLEVVTLSLVASLILTTIEKALLKVIKNITT